MASVTLTYNGQDAQDFAAWLGREDGLKDGSGNIRSATLAEAKEHLRQYVRTRIISYRRTQGLAALSITEPDITAQ